MKKIYPLIFFFFISTTTNAQYWLRFGGGLTIDEGLAIAIDSADNTYTTGYYTSVATFGTFNIASAGLDDIFLVKTNSAGIVSWLKSAGGTDVEKALAVDADNAGNTVIAGYFYGTSQFDSQTITSVGQQDIFIAKYDPSGTVLWAISAGGSLSDIGNGVAIDDSGNVIVTGEFSGSCTFGGFTLTSMNNSIDAFIAKYDSNGNFLWVKQGAGNYTDRGTDVATDSIGNIYVSGMFGDTITFDNTYNNTMLNAMFLIKYDEAGQEQWFRWMGTGSAVTMAGIAVHGSDVNLAGNFYGTLFFLGGSGNPSLSSSHPNNIFICRYDSAGNYLWSTGNGSESDVDVQSIATKPNGEVAIAGNFKCRFTDYSNQYGDGIFCSIGFSDAYTAVYDNSGNWLWARQNGSQFDDYAYSIATLTTGNVITTGSYQDKFCSTAKPGSYYGYETTPFLSTVSSYCTDVNYNQFVTKQSNGNSDVYINNNFDLSRQPYDFFKRFGSVCNRPFRDACVSTDYVNCKDSFWFCNPVNIYASTNMYDPISPLMFYLWSTGSQFTFLHPDTSGQYSIQISSMDGCFLMQDTFYVTIDSTIAAPAITDSKGININATSPLPITLCPPDSVQLFCSNVGSNTVQWIGKPVGVNPIMVANAGNYTCVLTSPTGCTKSIAVQVVIDFPSVPIIPKLKCFEDFDDNDSITICQGDFFQMFAYDSISNPFISPGACIPNLTIVNWSTTNSLYLSSYSLSSLCIPIGLFTPSNAGDFDYLITAQIIRQSGCDSLPDTVYVTKHIYVHINPAITNGNLNITITGATDLCYGDTIKLVASGGYSYTWTTGETTDSIYITQPGYYTANSSFSIINSFGCNETYSGFATVYINVYPQPNITMVPVDGVICPNDSVLLICSGTGNFSWEGPNGTIPINSNSIYVYTPGFYFCVVNPSPTCGLVSNTVQVIQNSLPTIISFPGTSLCETDSIGLMIITDVSSVIAWLPPLSGNNVLNYISAPGTYSCNVTSCGITTLLSMDITKGFTQPSSQSFSICNGDSVLVGSNYYSQSGIYSDTLISFYGCDSVVETNLNVLPNSISILSNTICEGDSILFGNNFYSASGIYADTLTAVNGCDSIIGINLTVNPASTFNQQLSICNGDSIQVGNNFYSISGTYIDSLSSSTGCDSIITTILSVTSVINANQQLAICSGDSVLVGSNYYSLPGTYVDTINTVSGCDSVVTTLLNVNTSSISNQQLSICDGDSVQVGNNFYSVAGNYSDTLNALNGCDSIVKTSLTINSISITNQQATLCIGDSILFNGFYIFVAGNYSDSLTSTAGCDSIIMLNVAINQQLNIQIAGDSIICEGTSTTLVASGGTSYSWSPPSGLNTTSGSTVLCSTTINTIYTVTSIDTSGCSSGKSIFVMIENSPSVSFSFTSNQNDCKNEVVFSNSSAGAISYEWNFGDSVFSNDVNPVHIFNNGNYVVQLVGFNADGCSDSTTTNLSFADSGMFISIPNVFTPNGDGINDDFTIKSNCIQKIQTQIYNQWGNLLFETTENPPHWNGKFVGDDVPQGVYFYTITITDASGKENSFKGTVMLLK